MEAKNKKKVVIEFDLKTIIVVLVAIVAVAAVFFISNNLGDRSNDKNESAKTSQSANPLLETDEVLDEGKMVEAVPQISWDGFKEALNGKKVTVVMLGYDDCYWCQQEKEILRMYLYNKEVNIKYLDISKITNDQFSELKDLHDSLSSFGTPTFIAVKKGKVTNVDTQGARGTSGLTTMFEEMGAM